MLFRRLFFSKPATPTPAPEESLSAEEIALAALKAQAMAELDSIVDAPKDSLTLILPSKGRPAMLKALLTYYNTTRLPYKILLLLSGDEGLHHPSHYPNLDLTIMPFAEDTPFPTKLIMGARQVRTPLVALITDDDITLADSLKKSAGFLASNPEYSAAQGYHVSFSQENENINLMSIAWFCPSAISDDPLRRLHEIIRRYQPICWAAFRTNTFAKIMDAVRPELPLVFQELLWSLTAVIDGKIKRLPQIYCLRRMDRGHLSGHAFLAMFESPAAYFLHYETYRNMLVEQLIPHVSRSKNDIARMLDLSYVSYLSREVDSGSASFFAEQVLTNPAASMTDDEVDRQLRPIPQHSQSGWEYTLDQNGYSYRLFQNFVNPEARNEIHLPPDYDRRLIQDIARYFTAETLPQAPSV
jgi:glycosyltransferase domain-containing protein